MALPETLRAALIAGDADTVSRIIAHFWPHHPQPRDPIQLAAQMHMARTVSNSVPLRPRAYSHRWLTERGFPSGLPDNLRPTAERIYPRQEEAVGVCVIPRRIEPTHAEAIEGAMIDAVWDIYADSKSPAPQRVKRRILEVHDRERAR